MKNTITKHGLGLLFLVSLSISACLNADKNQSAEVNTPAEVEQAKENTSDVADAAFVDGMTGKAFHNYLQLREALVNSDADGAQTAAGNLAEGFTAERAGIQSTARKIAETDDLETQRNLFFELTKQVKPLFKNGLAEGTIYLQYCPMAFDNTGATWFSDVPEIRNPYFGDRMLKCGKIEETIQKK